MWDRNVRHCWKRYWHWVDNMAKWEVWKDREMGNEPVTEPGYPEPDSYPVRRCLQAILTEEWEHRLYAERDLDLLTAGNKPARPGV